MFIPNHLQIQTLACILVEMKQAKAHSIIISKGLHIYDIYIYVKKIKSFFKIAIKFCYFVIMYIYIRLD
jgi:hypothetical protein